MRSGSSARSSAPCSCSRSTASMSSTARLLGRRSVRRLAKRERLAAAGERALGREHPIALAPSVRAHAEVRVVELVHMQTARLAATVGPGLAEAGCHRDRYGPLDPCGDLELSSLRDRALMDVPGHDQLRARVDE